MAQSLERSATQLFYAIPKFLYAGICDNYLNALLDHEHGMRNTQVNTGFYNHPLYWTV